MNKSIKVLKYFDKVETGPTLSEAKQVFKPIRRQSIFFAKEDVESSSLVTRSSPGANRRRISKKKRNDRTVLDTSIARGPINP